MGQMVSIFFGSIAGLLKLGPFVATELFTGKKMASYDPSIPLDTTILKHHKTLQQENFKDIYFSNPNDSVKLHAVVDSGRQRQKGKRPIIFVHGFPEMWISWLEQLEYFSKEGHPVLALDMRGYGLSDKPKNLDQFHMFNNVVEDIRSAVQYFTKECNNETPLLVAHDWGAGVCWPYVCQSQTTQNKEVVGYVTLAIPPGEMFQAKMGWKQFWASLYMLFFNMPWLPEFSMLFNNAWLIGRMMNTTKVAILPDWMTNAYRNNCLQPNAMTAQFNYYRNSIQKQPKPAEEDVLGPKGKTQRKLDLPVLMIRGKDDAAITGDLFEGYEEYLTNARLLALDNCSHWIQADCPDTVNAEIEKLLGEVA